MPIVQLCQRILALTSVVATAFGQEIISLDSQKWTLGNGVNVSNVPAKFPSQAHLDLYAAGVIGDPLYGENDYQQLWVQRSNWTYQSSPISGLSNNHGLATWLVFEGLDTFTYIEMCGQAVGNADNQFRQWYFDVSHIVSSCQNEPNLSLNFGSASKIVLEIANSSAADSEDNFVNGVKGQEFQGKIYARKEQNDFGWDWSPSFAPAGPWRTASLVQLPSSGKLYVRNALIDIYRQGQMNNLPPQQSVPWVFNASIDYLGQLPNGAQMNLKLVDDQGQTVVQTLLNGVYSNNETITGSTSISPSQVTQWWPNGMGNQTLYNATLAVTGQHGEILCTETRRVGFRTIVLNLSPVSEQQLAQGIAPGSNWHFEINGQEFYAKGSNLVPVDVFWPRVNETKIRQLFEVARVGNQNMLRVWSSGAYLPDFIYDIADETGILLWSEFEFSDAEYPSNKTDLANYEAEAYYNIRRVNHHPSLALWVGGNELEQIQLAYFGPGSYIRSQYELIFEEVLIKCVYANSKSISYIPSSTYNGYLSLNFNSTRPQTPRYKNTSGPAYIYSDSDYYNYDASVAFDLGSYPVGRFADEFGFISMPSTQSWLEITPEDTLTGIDSEIVVHRNRHYEGSGTPEDMSRAGIARMTAAVDMWYPRPNKADMLSNFSAWAYTTQVFQAEYYSHQIAFYRRGSGLGERQLGSLYWQLADLWVAPTWSSIEANGRQKLLYYSAKDLYKPVIIYPYYNLTQNSSTTRMDVYVTSDQWHPASGTAHFEWINWKGDSVTPLNVHSTVANASSFSVPFAVGAINTTRVVSYPNVSALFPATSSSRSSNSSLTNVTGLSDVLLRMSVVSGNNTHTSYFHPAPLANSSLTDPGLKLSHSTQGGSIIFTITATNGVAAWVWMEYQTSQVQGYFEDNGFWLNKGESRQVAFRIFNDWTGNGSWADGVTVRSLWDNTTP